MIQKISMRSYLLKTIVFVILYFFTLFYLQKTIVLKLATLFKVSDFSAFQNVVASTDFIVYLLLIIISLLIFGKELLSEIREIRSVKKYIFTIIIGWIALSVSGYLSTLIVGVITQTKETSVNQQGVVEILKVLPLLTITSTVLFGPLVEEIVFRYGIMRIFLHKYPWIGIVVSSFAFGILHVISAGDYIHAIPYIAMGFVLGCIYYKSRNIWCAIGAHILQNLFSTLVIFFVQHP